MRGWAVIVLIGAVMFLFALRQIHPFLAVNDPVSGGAMVVEGWAPDYALESAIAEFRKDHYEKLYVTGGPMERGAPLSEYKTYAELGAATVVKLGLSGDVVQAVPAPWVRRDRTHACAVALRDWLREHGVSPGKVNLITVGPHARRSRLLFQKVLGNDVTMGVTAIPDKDYDPDKWWRSSQGVRVVLSEMIAYVYVRIVPSAAR